MSSNLPLTKGKLYGWVKPAAPNLCQQQRQLFGSCPHHTTTLCQLLPPPFCPQPSVGHALIYKTVWVVPNARLGIMKWVCRLTSVGASDGEGKGHLWPISSLLKAVREGGVDFPLAAEARVNEWGCTERDARMWSCVPGWVSTTLKWPHLVPAHWKVGQEKSILQSVVVQRDFRNHGNVGVANSFGTWWAGMKENDSFKAAMTLDYEMLSVLQSTWNRLDGKKKKKSSWLKLLWIRG